MSNIATSSENLTFGLVRKLPRLKDRKWVNINSIWTHFRCFNPGALTPPKCLIFTRCWYKHLYLLLFIACIPILFTGCYKKTSKQQPPAPRVTTTSVAQQDVPIYIDAIGQVISPVTVNIRPQANGKLIKAYIKQGAIVKEGDVLYRNRSKALSGHFR